MSISICPVLYRINAFVNQENYQPCVCVNMYVYLLNQDFSTHRTHTRKHARTHAHRLDVVDDDGCREKTTMMTLMMMLMLKRILMMIVIIIMMILIMIKMMLMMMTIMINMM
jgi:hypothetical protein